MNIAVIPARGSSKRIPRKNIREFCGQPMIARSIHAAIRSKCFEKIIVSTDDQEIAKISENSGAEVPFMRPKSLSDDHTGTVPVIKHAVEWALNEGLSVERACCIYATAPFISDEDILAGLNLLSLQPVDFAFSVTSFPFPVQRAIKLNGDSHVEMLNPELFHVRSQDLEEVWHDAGQFYWGKVDAWLNEKVIFENAVGVKLPRYRVQDIDVEEDWIRAEAMFKVLVGAGRL